VQKHGRQDEKEKIICPVKHPVQGVQLARWGKSVCAKKREAQEIEVQRKGSAPAFQERKQANSKDDETNESEVEIKAG
jgi:hypothetical protein